MPSDGKKEQQENLMDKLRSFFGPQDPQKKKDALPPKAQFSIWYVLVAILLIYLSATILFFRKSGDDSLQPI